MASSSSSIARQVMTLDLWSRTLDEQGKEKYIMIFLSTEMLFIPLSI